MKLTDLDVTLVIGLDATSLQFFREAAKTWRHFRPELFEVPWIVFRDQDLSLQEASSAIDYYPHDTQHVCWIGAGKHTHETQREYMLTGHVFVPAQHMTTKWHLKIDCDAICLSDQEWLRREWFDDYYSNAYIASSWKYTKAKGGGGTGQDWAFALENWGDGVTDSPRLELLDHVDGNRINYPRMASWLSFYRHDFTQRLAAACEAVVSGKITKPDDTHYKLPVPSQDTTAWYYAARRRLNVCTERRMFKRRGWTNVSNLDKLRHEVAKLSSHDIATTR